MRLSLLFCAALTFSMNADAAEPLRESRQCVLVIAPEWSSTSGQLWRLERVEAKWRVLGEAAAVSLGRKGLAARKVEGDERAPAGVFPLESAFGIADQAPTKMPYWHVTPRSEAVDDPHSRWYNRIVDRAQIAQPDWRSSEKMSRIAKYRLGLVVGYNTAPVKPGAGSCIFLHVWQPAHAPTSGCTAMAEADLKSLLDWLDPSQRPVLTQWPRAEYERLRHGWGLPDVH